jgi:hypothetical protein
LCTTLPPFLYKNGNIFLNVLYIHLLSPPPPPQPTKHYLPSISTYMDPGCSVLGCCTAVPGSIPARHSSLSPAERKLFAQMQELLIQLRKKEYPAGEHPEEE